MKNIAIVFSVSCFPQIDNGSHQFHSIHMFCTVQKSRFCFLPPCTTDDQNSLISVAFKIVGSKHSYFPEVLPDHMCNVFTQFFKVSVKRKNMTALCTPIICNMFFLRPRDLSYSSVDFGDIDNINFGDRIPATEFNFSQLPGFLNSSFIDVFPELEILW